MKPQELFIPTTWRIKGSDAEVYEILSKPLEFVRWWSDVYLAVREVKPGDADGVGRVVEMTTKGKLPYTLRWQAEMTAADKPRRMSIRARGDLEGGGEWEFRQEGESVLVTYGWTVLATKPWMIHLAPLLNPVFIWNHRWAMQRGLEGLQRELARRQAP
jgi:polyketide cyclase/dehydrase/lipid transport protein